MIDVRWQSRYCQVSVKNSTVTNQHHATRLTTATEGQDFPMNTSLATPSPPHPPSPPSTAAAVTPRGEFRPTSFLLGRVHAAAQPEVLVAAGLAIRTFTEPCQQRSTIGVVDLHRATTTLTKELLNVRTNGEWSLDAVRRVVLDPHRISYPSGPTVDALIGETWPAVQRVAAERMTDLICGQRDYGIETVTRLAAIRAAQPGIPWWGTADWERMVGNFLQHDGSSRRQRHLLQNPERATETELTGLLISSGIARELIAGVGGLPPQRGGSGRDTHRFAAGHRVA